MLKKDTTLARLQRLREADPKLEVFGARAHKYQLNPPLSEDAVRAVEEMHQMALPPDYRDFLLEIGNGGAGPYYGLFRLGEEDDGFGHCSWEKGFLLCDPSQPFPYQEAWNLPDSFWKEMPDPPVEISYEEEDRMMEEWDLKVNERYWHSNVMNGAIPICHLGCACRQWLVVAGPEKGHVWNDDRVDNNGIHPVRSEAKERVTFTDWYLGWLQECETKVG